MRLHFTILGRPRPKKNSMRIVRTANGKPFLLPSQANVSWTNDAVRQLRDQWQSQRGRLPALDAPLSVTYRFYLVNRRSEADADNLMAAVNDALQKAGVIADDKLIRCGVFSKSYDADQPRTELVITAAIAEGAA